MKPIQSLIILAGLAVFADVRFSPDAVAATADDATEVAAPAASTEAPAAKPMAEAALEDKSTNAVTPFDPANPDAVLRMNFRGAPLEMVLNYLSEAAGFIINLEATPRGRVDVWSNTPLTKEEAVNLLNSVLKKNGFAAIRNGRTLTIVNRDEAKIHDIPVILGSDPDKIPRNDEIVTQIIPVRFVEVAQLLKDLQPLISVQTTMTANEAGNSLVITDSQANIHRVAEIIKAIDLGAEDGTEVRVFRLQFADPSEMSELLANLFPDDTRSGGSSAPVQFGGFRRFFGGGMPGGGGQSGGSSQNSRIKKRAKVVAVPDPRTSSVVVSAARDLIAQIEAVVTELDSNPARKQNVKVIQLQNADAEEVQQVLEEMFEKNTSSNNRNRTGNNQNSTLRNRSNNQQNTGNNTSRTRTSGNNRSGFGQ
jgi:general secretion pathway protein D